MNVVILAADTEQDYMKTTKFKTNGQHWKKTNTPSHNRLFFKI